MPRTIHAALLLLIVVSACSLLGPGQVKRSGFAIGNNPIQAENLLPGTTDWELTNGSLAGEIQAYAGETSINRGGTVHLYVSTTAPSYQVDIYRLGYYQGLGGRYLETLPNNPGTEQGYYPNDGTFPTGPLNCATCITSFKDSLGTETDLTDANWNLSLTIPFPASWISGIYLLKLTESATLKEWQVPIVVRDDSASAAILAQDPIDTDEAYNLWGGANAYTDYRRGSGNGYYLSFNRPYLQDFGAGHLFYWTYSMTRFLEEHGYDVRYSTNTAIAERLTNPLNYRVFLDAGHDEYWSAPERQQLVAAEAAGINVAFFGANDLYWQIRTVPDEHGTPDRWDICYKDLSAPFNDPDTGTILDTVRWRDPAVNEPEDQLLKAEYGFDNTTRNGTNAHNLQNMLVTNTATWPFAGTNLKDGSVLFNSLGEEIDTMYQDGSAGPNDHITILAQSPYLSIGNEEWTAFSVLDQVTGGAFIFDAGTMFWPQALSSWDPHTAQRTPYSPALERLTMNLLNRMTGNFLL